MRDFVARRIADIPPSGIRRFFDIVATMQDVISLGIGEPDFTTPEPILHAGIRSLQDGHTHYTSNSGILELRAGDRRADPEAVRRDLRTAQRDPGHRRRIGSVVPGAGGDARSGRRGHRPHPVFRRLSAGDAPGRRDACAAADARRRCLPGGGLRRRGADHAAHQGAAHRLPEQPDRRRDVARAAVGAGARGRGATTCWSSRTRSTTGWCTPGTSTCALPGCPACASGPSPWAASPRPTP